MGRMILFIVLLTLTSMLGQFLLPWWIIAPLCFVLAIFFKLTPWRAFLSAFLALFVLWILVAAMKDLGNHVKISQIIGGLLGDLPAFLSYLLTGALGGIIGGLSALSGSIVNTIIDKSKTTE